MAAMMPPPGMAQLLAQLAITNPQALAAIMAAKGAVPPQIAQATPQTPMTGNPGQAPTSVTPAAPPATNPGPPASIGPQLPAAAGPTASPPAAVPPSPNGGQDMASQMMPGVSAGLGLMAPSAAGGGGGGVRYPPQAPQPPGALSSQLPDILKLLMAGAAPTPTPSLGNLILGR